MTDYSKMSGYEINNRVHNILVCDSLYELTVEGYRVTWKDRKTGKETVTLRKQYDAQFKNYCGSWADAGPMAEKYCIGTMPSDRGNHLAWDTSKGLMGDNQAKSDKLCRAICIVFLMMNEGE